MSEPARDYITHEDPAEIAQFRLTPFWFKSFGFTPLKVAALELATLALTLLGYAQVGAGAFPRMAAEFMAFLRGWGTASNK